jgi:Flp pilus assembly protein TadG
MNRRFQMRVPVFIRRSSFSRFISEDGSSILETALILPVMILMLVGAVDFGRAYYVAIEVNSAAHAAALYGAQNFTDITGMTAVATANATDVRGMTASASYGCECYDGSSAVPLCATAPAACIAPGAAAGSSNIGNVVYYVQVKTKATYTPVLSFPGIPASISLSGQSLMRAAY